MFQYLSQVPRGKKVAAADFVTVFGAAAAAELSKRGVQSVSESNGRISVAALREQEFPLLKQGRMRLAAQSSFAYQGTDNRIRITAIQGVTVTRPGAPGWVNLDGIELSPGAAGQVRVSSKREAHCDSFTDSPAQPFFDRYDRTSNAETTATPLST